MSTEENAKSLIQAATTALRAIDPDDGLAEKLEASIAQGEVNISDLVAEYSREGASSSDLQAQITSLLTPKYRKVLKILTDFCDMAEHQNLMAQAKVKEVEGVLSEMEARRKRRIAKGRPAEARSAEYVAKRDAQLAEHLTGTKRKVEAAKGNLEKAKAIRDIIKRYS